MKNIFCFTPSLLCFRVSKRWNRLLSDPQSWTHVDFCQEQQVPGSRKMRAHRKDKTWKFPMAPNSVLAFLKRYTSGSLKSIYLNAVNEETLQYLKKNCRNLETISLLSPVMNSLLEKIPLPKTLKVCELSFENRFFFHQL